MAYLYKPCVICEEAMRRTQTPAEHNPRWNKAFTEFSEFRHRDYVNIYEKCPDEPRVFGTESLFGDWDADVLFLAKDFAPSKIIKERLKSKDTRIYRASCICNDGSKYPGVQTNRSLVNHYAPDLPVDTRLLYGSVCGGLMRTDGETSGRLPDWDVVRKEYCVPFINFVVSSAPKLRVAIALGEEAWNAVAVVAGCSASFAEARENTMHVMVAGCPCFAAYHPSRWKASNQDSWLRLVPKLTL